jgi:1-acyl-sn-glycerol-3-phosphate acyltransferase
MFYGNHSNWWDGLVEFLLTTEVFGFDSYLMMEEKQMTRYRFFRWIGAFSVNRARPRDVMASIRYAASIFTRPNRALWIYPQAEMRPNDVRPLRFFGGLARIVELTGRVQLVPVAHRYEFLMEQRPEVFTAFGVPEIVEGIGDREEFLRERESRLTRLLDEVRAEVTEGRTGGYATILRGYASANVRLDRARGKGSAG